MKYFLTVPVVLLFLMACENPITFVWEVNITTDLDNYMLSDSASVSIVNRSEEPVDVRICDEFPYFNLQRQVGVEWETVYTGECPGEARFDSIPVGQSRLFTIDLSVLSDGEEISGTYRIETILYPGSDRRVRLPITMRISNTFTITDPDEGETDS